MNIKNWIKLYLRISLGVGFLSACADRFGFWAQQYSAWGDWNHFIQYTATLNPWFPHSFIQPLGIIATSAEIIFGLALIVGFKLKWVAPLSGLLLLVFAVSMTFSTGIKTALDASVYSASAGAFLLGTLSGRFLEIKK